jgi:hypothetical protein
MSDRRSGTRGAFKAHSAKLPTVSFLVLLVLTTAPSPLLPNRASLFVVSKDTDTRAEAELRRALEERTVSLSDLEVLFPDDSPPNRGAALMREGINAVDNLDFEKASARFTEALSFWNQSPAMADANEIGRAHLHLANIALLTGGTSGQKAAAKHIAEAIVFAPSFELDSKYFGSDLKKLVKSALVAFKTTPKATLTITSVPLGAEVSFRGAVLGFTPLSASPSVPLGRHLVTARRPGFRPAGAYVTVTQDFGGAASLELTATERYDATRASIQPLISANLGKGVPLEARAIAEATQSRFLIVAEVGSAGTGQLEVWDAETKACLKNVTLTNDGNVGPAVDRVKAFIANPVPLPVTHKPHLAAPAERTVNASVFSRWWFWTVVGVAVATGIGFGIASQSDQLQPGFNPSLFPY